LNVFGPASLAHLLSTTTTPLGRDALRRWLLEPASQAGVAARQEAVAELAPALDWRQALERTGRMSDSHPDPETFLAWAEGEPWLARRPALRWVARISTAVLWLAVAANVLGLIGAPLWIGPLVLNLVLSQTVGVAVNGVIGRATTRHRAMSHYAEMLRLLADRPWATEWSREATASLVGAGTGAPAALRRLDRLAALVIPRGSQLYVPIQTLTLWDVHVLDALERWQVGPGRQARGWLDALGQVEAIAALAALAHAEPDWVFPAVGANETTVRATALAHPLLPASRVANDVHIGPPGSFLLVTGSNMSGKSTLLRAIGTNAVLAGMGAPVCAGAMTVPPVRIATSARVEDSLARGVSFFLAELHRLKGVVEVAAQGHDDGRRCLFLLDEILQGTNTAERQVAARQIIRRLVDLGAIGAVSTHDLTLAESPVLADAADPIHFRETVGDAPGQPPMSFDYLSRPGLATSTNALRLMRLMGLDVTGDQAGGEEISPAPLSMPSHSRRSSGQGPRS
ncbi:MAG: DNA mismatch repair protein MutS, partial [Chloroflexia bacterium]|nr:DNA mismatch repair protein MutS [Chloroflexia bacterium]